jgi:hypothetical protein
MIAMQQPSVKVIGNIVTYPIDGPYEVECYGLKGVKHEFIKGYKR